MSSNFLQDKKHDSQEAHSMVARMTTEAFGPPIQIRVDSEQLRFLEIYTICVLSASFRCLSTDHAQTLCTYTPNVMSQP